MRSGSGAITVEDYIRSQESSVTERLLMLRTFIFDVVPQAEEKMSYGMPSYHYQGPLIYFGAFKNHIGIYPTAEPIVKFAEQLKGYKTSKGAIQLPHNKDLPLDLIRKILLFRYNKLQSKT